MKKLPMIGKREMPEPVGTSCAGDHIDDATLNKLFERWRFEREHYPGWVVAPESKRELIWIYTSHWIRPLLQAAARLMVSERIILFSELNWRLELSMVPLFEQEREAFRNAFLEAREPLVSHNTAALNAKSAGLNFDVSAQRVRECWLELGFALLREARETYRAEDWETFKEHIESVEKEESDRLQYEKALWACWNIDRNAARKILRDWRPAPQEPLSCIRKAGLLAEVDLTSEAQELLARTLDDIREREQAHANNISLLSLEGWCMYLLSSIHMAVGFAEGKMPSRRSFAERWTDLAAWDCDPTSTVEIFRLQLSKTAPNERPSTNSSSAFDPGRVVHSMHFGSIDAYLPAFAYIRLFEQVGLPLRLSHVDTTQDQFEYACKWISEFIGYWSPALLIRANKLEALESGNTFSRSVLAKLDGAIVRQLNQWCLAIWKREVRPAVTREHLRLRDSLLACLAESMSRFTIRLDENELNEAFRLALQTLDWRTNDTPQWRSLRRTWFDRLYVAADNRTLLQWLPDLVRAPIESGSVESTSECFDPMESFPSYRLRFDANDCAATSEKLSEAKNWLFKSAAVLLDFPTARNQILTRLCRLHGAKYLTEQEQALYGEMLWRYVGEDGLPLLDYPLLETILDEPSPPSVSPYSLLKQAILKNVEWHGVARISSSSSAIHVGTWRDEADLVFQAAYATKALPELPDEESGRIEWSVDESRRLLARLFKWWEHVKPRCADRLSGPFDIDKSELSDGIATFVIRILVPVWSSLDDSDTKKLMLWFDELRSMQVYPTESFPYLSLQGGSGNFGARVQQDLIGDNQVSVRAAVRAALQYAAMRETLQDWPSVHTLSHKIAERIAFRRRAGLLASINGMCQLLAFGRRAVADATVELMCNSFSTWSEVLDLRSPESREFPLDERPDLRWMITQLAGELSVFAPEHPNIELWRDMSNSDPLPEMRRGFRDGREFVKRKQQ